VFLVKRRGIGTDGLSDPRKAMKRSLVSSPRAGHRTRILQLFSRYREFGGEEGSVYRIGDALHRDFDIGFFLTSSDEAFAGNAFRRGVSVLKAFSNWDVIRDLKRYQRLADYDFWLVHNVFPAMSPGVYDLAFKNGIPIVQYLHNYRMGCINGFFLNHGTPCQTCMHGDFRKAFRTGCWHESRIQSGIMGMITSRTRGMDLFGKVHHWITISEAQKSEHVAMGIPQEKITVVPHFYESQESSDTNFPEQGDALFVGRLSPEKGVDRLIEAWRLIHDCGRNLWIVGDGPERLRLEVMVHEAGIRNVRFTGFLSHPEMKDIWAKVSCSIVPSVWKEPFGMVVLESWAKSRPVIAHRIGALPEIITDHVNGILVGERQPHGMAEAMLSLLQNRSRAEALGKAGHEKLITHYSRESWRKAINPIFSLPPVKTP
jgi:glycosyltransferase involved in cell wall biosynthesis